MTALAKRRVFDAVFPTSAYTTTATPAATPVIGGGASGSSFASTQEDQSVPVNLAAETIKWERAWHVVIDFLALPRDVLSSVRSDNVSLSPSKRFSKSSSSSSSLWFKQCTIDISRAIAYTSLHGPPGSLPYAQHQNAFEWYSSEVGQHFQIYEFPKLVEVTLQSSSLDIEANSLSCYKLLKEVKASITSLRYSKRRRLRIFSL